MYRKLPNLVLGFHGCNKTTFDNVIRKGEELKPSTNSYDWLGSGIYFWEHNLQRAEEWAKNKYGADGAVIGAVIDLGYCLNLTDSASAAILKSGYDILEANCALAGIPLPINRPSAKSSDILQRDLDCSVIQQVHDYNQKEGLPAYDSVRGIFTEGGPPYCGSAFFEKTHTQICVCNPNCIKGYFSPKQKNNNYALP